MRIVALVVMLIASACVYGQVYLQQDLGYAFKKNGDKTAVIGLHAGVQLNNIILPQGVALLEYNQRVLIGGGINPVYLGGRAGYGYTIKESVTVALWGAEYYRLLSSGGKGANYWIHGYGLSVIWKSLSLDISNVEIYHLSVGCRYLFN